MKIRTFLTATALATLLSTSAFSAAATTTDGAVPIFSKDGEHAAPVIKDGYFVNGDGAVLASSLIGATIYNGTGDDAVAIGDVNDIVIGPHGDAEAMVVGVGGFLGIGEKDVAVAIDRIQRVDRDGERWIVIDATKEQLDAAPSYDRVAVASKPEHDMAMTSATTKDPQPDSTPTAHDTTKADGAVMAMVDVSTMKASDLDGARVHGAGNRDIGEVSDVIVTDAGSVEAFVVDVGGFLGIGEKRVAIGAENIDFVRDVDGSLIVVTPFSQEQLERQAAYSEESYKADPQTRAMRAPKS